MLFRSTVLLRFSSLGKKTKILKSENLWPKIKVILIIAILLRQIWTMLLIVIFIRFKTPYAKKKKRLQKEQSKARFKLLITSNCCFIKKKRQTFKLNFVMVKFFS